MAKHTEKKNIKLRGCVGFNVKYSSSLCSITKHEIYCHKVTANRLNRNSSAACIRNEYSICTCVSVSLSVQIHMYVDTDLVLLIMPHTMRHGEPDPLYLATYPLKCTLVCIHDACTCIPSQALVPLFSLAV